MAELRQQIAAGLAEHEQQLAAEPPPEGKVPLPQPLKQPRNFAHPFKRVSKGPQPGTYDPAVGYVPDPNLSPADNEARKVDLKSAYDLQESETPVTQKLAEAGRAGLAIASGGLTERTAESVAGAGGQAKSEVESKTLETLPQDELMGLLAQAGLAPQQQQAVYATIAPHWQPGQRTSAEGVTGKDPNAVRAAMELQGTSEKAQTQGLKETQEADRGQYEALQKVQQNQMEATKTFKTQHDQLQDRYEQERQQQNDRMATIQKAMDAVPNAPRTIRERMDKTGFSEKAALGLAAAFSVLGGAMQRDGGKSVQTFLGNMQANIDRGVQKEIDEYSRLGDRAKMSNNIYANLRTGLQDDVQAMNLTKALYYDAAANAIQQIATQYKMDMQSPQIQQLLQSLAEQRQKLILDTANNMQSQFSQTDKFNPGGVVQVGGFAGKDPNEYKSTDLEKDTQKFSKELDERGFNMGERAAAMYQQAIETMRDSGFKNDESFKRAFVVLSDPKASPGMQAGVLMSLDPKEKKALQLIVSANKEQLKDSSGKSVTANELTRDVLEKGGFSIDSLDQARQSLLANREQIYKGVARGYDPRIWQRSDARGDLAGMRREHAGIGTAPRQPVDVKDIAYKVEGRLKK